MPSAPPAEVGSIFGEDFTAKVFLLEPGHWSGPVESGYGWHAVFVERKTQSSVPDFDRVKDQVRTAWLDTRRAEFRQEAYRVMRAKYDVVLPDAAVARVVTGSHRHVGERPLRVGSR